MEIYIFEDFVLNSTCMCIFFHHKTLHVQFYLPKGLNFLSQLRKSYEISFYV